MQNNQEFGNNNAIRINPQVNNSMSNNRQLNNNFEELGDEQME